MLCIKGMTKFLSPFTSQLFAVVLVKNLTLVVALDLTNPLSHLRKLLILTDHFTIW